MTEQQIASLCKYEEILNKLSMCRYKEYCEYQKRYSTITYCQKHKRLQEAKARFAIDAKRLERRANESN
jgi:hypothetical protein